MVNPLLALSFNELPAFSLVRPEHVEIAIDELLNNNRHAVKTLLNNNKIYTWENLMWPLELMEGRLQDVWSVISHLNRVMNSSVFYKAYQRSLPKLTLYHTEIYQNENLYQAILSIQQAADYEKLDVAQKKVIKNWLRDFKRAGIALPPDKKVQFKQWNVKLSDLESQFEQNVLESTDAWSFLVTDRNQLKDLPTSTLDIAAKEASHHGKNGWLLTVDYPCYHAVMTYAEDRKLRELLYKAYATRAAEKDPWNNSPLMVEILQIRQTLAALLGFNHYSEYALDIRMLKKTRRSPRFSININ